MTSVKADIAHKGRQHVLSSLHEYGLLASLITLGRSSVIAVLAPDKSVIAIIYVRTSTKAVARGWTRGKPRVLL